MKTINIVAATVVLSGSVLVSGDGHANDHYPGANCRQTSGGTYSLYGGTVGNSSSTSDLNLVCPFVLDGDGTLASGSTIQVWDRHTTLNVSCTLVGEAVLTNGTDIVFVTESDNSTSSGSAAKVLTFSSVALASYAYAMCTIPRSSSGQVSHVIAANIVENGDFDDQ
jgi:hypothetical protein